MGAAHGSRAGNAALTRSTVDALSGRAQSTTTAPTMTDWKFARRKDRCTGCDGAFEEGVRHVSVLSALAETIVREDVCLACWARRASGAEIFYWFTRRTGDRPGLRLDLPTLEQIFLRLEGHAEPRMLELRYVLCLLLMRKKRLKLLRVVRDPRETLILRRPRRDETLPVVVCDLGTERIDEVRRELEAIFDGAEELPPPPAMPGADEVPPDLATSPCGV